MRKMIIAILLMLAAGAVRAENVKGVVLAADNIPVMYASVYLESNPADGTATDSQGFFSLEVDDASKKDILIISHVGFETVMVPINEVMDAARYSGSTSRFTLAGDILVFQLLEQPILLEESVVTSKPKRTNKRKEMKELLRLVANKMEVDFPDGPHNYKIVSSFHLYSGDHIVIFDELFGNVVEMPRALKNGDDYIQVKTDYGKRYLDARILDNLDSLKSNLLNEGELDVVNRADSTSIVHKTLWGQSVKSLFASLEKAPRFWSITRENDSLSVLTYHIKKNLLGIVKADLTINFIIGTYSYAVEQLSQSMDVQARIPFGYKLKPEELAILNMVNFTGSDFSKYRLKQADISIKRSILFTKTERETVVREKNIHALGSIQDNKGRLIQMRNSARMRITSFQTRGVKPYSAAELSRPIDRIIVPLSEAR